MFFSVNGNATYDFFCTGVRYGIRRNSSPNQTMSHELFSFLLSHFFVYNYLSCSTMFRFVLVLVAVAYASAFAPAARSSSRSMSMAMEGMSKSVPFLKKPKNLEGMAGNYE